MSGNDEAAIEAHLLDIEGFEKADREFFSGLLRGVVHSAEYWRDNFSPTWIVPSENSRRSRPVFSWRALSS